jgi:hypothetical protein
VPPAVPVLARVLRATLAACSSHAPTGSNLSKLPPARYRITPTVRFYGRRRSSAQSWSGGGWSAPSRRSSLSYRRTYLACCQLAAWLLLPLVGGLRALPRTYTAGASVRPVSRYQHGMPSDELTAAVVAHLQSLQDVSARRCGTAAPSAAVPESVYESIYECLREFPRVCRTQPTGEIALSNWKSQASA